MKPCIIKGSKQEIIEQLSKIEGEVSEAIIFINDPAEKGEVGESVFAEMEPFLAQAPAVDDSREGLYRRMQGE